MLYKFFCMRRSNSAAILSSSSEDEDDINRSFTHRSSRRRSRSPRRRLSGLRITGVVEVIDLESENNITSRRLPPRRVIIDLTRLHELQAQLARHQSLARPRPFLIRPGWPPEDSETPAVNHRAAIQRLPVHKIASSDEAKLLGTCPICLTDYRVRMTLRILPCGHKIHKTCFDRWAVRKFKCPLDNLSIGAEQ